MSAIRFLSCPTHIKAPRRLEAVTGLNGNANENDNTPWSVWPRKGHSLRSQMGNRPATRSDPVAGGRTARGIA
jgi:hypothetical protein